MRALRLLAIRWFVGHLWLGKHSLAWIQRVIWTRIVIPWHVLCALFERDVALQIRFLRIMDRWSAMEAGEEAKDQLQLIRLDDVLQPPRLA